MRRLRMIAALAAAAAVSAFMVMPGASAATLPSGEVVVGHTVIEPAYDDATGGLVYLSTPMGTHVNPNFDHNVAPIYLPVYPVGAPVGVLNCQDSTTTTTENCPDHGPEVAGAAMGISQANGFGSVYANGVLGHDHLVGIASSGGDFNVLWEPVLVLFTDSATAQHHITTLDQINSLVDNHQAIKVPLAAATFHCAAVSAAVYNSGVPYTG